MADVTEPEFGEYWRQNLSSLKSQCYDITNKYPEVACVVHQVYKVLSDIEILIKFTPAKEVESYKWTSIVRVQKRTGQTFAKF
jgi:arabinogalactan endo-1,4-beta-galactosidase